MWTLAWLAAAVFFHFRLVAALRAFGVDVPSSKQSRWWVVQSYLEVCNERQIDPTPRLRPIIVCVALAVPAWLYEIVRIARS